MTRLGTGESFTVIAAVSGQLTDAIAQHSAFAVFVLMAVDALLPVGGELIMLYAGVVAAGAISGKHATIFGVGFATGTESYFVLSLSGSLGYLAGALTGWAIGVRGGRPLIDRHGRRLHISPRTFQRAEEWFERYGLPAVFLGRITPVVRSFISVPAGVFATPLVPYTLLTLLGSMVWCFAFAGVGWAVGDRWESFHHDFRYADYASVALLLALGAMLLRHRRRHRGASP
jgi:membrane protein DedA with SNARE-associated domain